mgnify:CR=1 FL=1
MSSNRLMYDTCEYKTRINESVSPLNYMMDPSRYENCNKCRMELGIIGGTAVSNIRGNLVDLETDLKGISRKASLCPGKKYQSPCPNGDLTNCHQNSINISPTPGTQGRQIDTELVHLPSCQMIRYKPVPLPPPMDIPSCNRN